ncbi:MAG: plastocyanin/azurin family copper-binding protein [Halobellus sp.]|uniref:cupredoxin domain-containing protein n=1 Tax=Halobellus sp. TaxID=1979212 RepID=UPI0035D525AF
MNRRKFFTVAAATLFVAGCTGGSGGSGEQGTTPAGSVTAAQGGASPAISMKDTTFQTLRAEVDAGATVKWVNNDGVPHTVTAAQFHDTAKSWSFDKEVSGGGSVTRTFEEKGVYEYYCAIHGKSTMCGAVLVGGATLDKSLPCADGGGGGGSDEGPY